MAFLNDYGPGHYGSNFFAGGKTSTLAPKVKKADPFEDSITSVGDEAHRLQEIEDTRGADTQTFLRDEFEKASKPTFTDDYYDKMFTGYTDQAARTQLGQERGLRDNMGANGITGGGYAQGLLTGFEGQRWGTVTDSRRSLSITKAQEQAEQQYKRFTMAQPVAAQMGREPSLLGLDYTQWAANQRLTKYGIDKQAKAAKKQSENNLFGDIFKGVTSFAAGAFL